MDWYTEAMDRQHERLHSAEVTRMVRQAQKSSDVHSGPRAHFMMWLGRRLVESGHRLEMQYK
ncbi:MAG: hypothetical protein ABI670_05780 [Chloroflexota bacterium]